MNYTSPPSYNGKKGCLSFEDRGDKAAGLVTEEKSNNFSTYY